MRNPIINALDVPSAEDARPIVKTPGDTASICKVGRELYAAAGMEFVKEPR